MAIKFYYDGVKYRLKESKRVKELLTKVIRKYSKMPGDLNYIFTDDNTLLEINRKFLNHDYYTDVITFDYSDKFKIKGEIYISIDTVRDNSINYKVSLRDEVIRILVHGTLHLCGLDDATNELREAMSREENVWIKKFKEGVS